MDNLRIPSMQRVDLKRGQFLCFFRKQSCRKWVCVTKLVKERLLTPQESPGRGMRPNDNDLGLSCLRDFFLKQVGVLSSWEHFRCGSRVGRSSLGLSKSQLSAVSVILQRNTVISQLRKKKKRCSIMSCD